MLEEFMTHFDYQLQLALMLLIVIMAALTWRAHHQISKLSGMSTEMRESLAKLEHTTEVVSKIATSADAMQGSLAAPGGHERATSTSSPPPRRRWPTRSRGSRSATDEITQRTSETEETLRSNLEEYRMAQGSTNAYREYLQNMGLAPASDVEPILEAIPDGAEAVSIDGKILYANKAFAELTSIRPGATLEEIAFRCRVRDFSGEQLTRRGAPRVAGAHRRGALGLLDADAPARPRPRRDPVRERSARSRRERQGRGGGAPQPRDQRRGRDGDRGPPDVRGPLELEPRRLLTGSSAATSTISVPFMPDPAWKRHSNA